MYYRLELVNYIITVHSYFVFILQVYTLRRSSKTPTRRNWQSCYGCHTLCFTNMGLWPVFAYTLPFTIVNCSQGFHYPHYSTSSTTLHTTVMLSHGHKSVRACANCVTQEEEDM
ncbi:uncharacterized protein LOC126916888 isoform X2 [Bombus affinis]|uniref:uncharacterized protein LOC126916888 isoform X2 n=1 Tax=Bombus affinis TaxID=309941 RepID=UPI0021B71D3D|nr:uncharacterized protein LOC126916888 isoform X2 [Bombus affinis]